MSDRSRERLQFAPDVVASPTEPQRTYWPGVIEAFRTFLPVTPKTPVVSLLEGGTPLLRAPRLSRRVGAEVWLKLEGANPTGSFKDRGMTLAISKAVEDGAQAVICASTGNTSASAAAYAARSGLDCVVLVPDGQVALGKLAQAVVHGARICQVRGNFDRALGLVRELAEVRPLAVVNSINPFRLEGQKTAAYEVVDAMGDAPDSVFIPVGNAGNITAYWRGFKECLDLGRATRLPAMFGFQAEGAAPIVAGHRIDSPETIATAIRIGNPASWSGAVGASQESGGGIHAVSDDEILAAYRYLAREEAVFCEPASAAAVAGLLARGVEKGSRTVCVLTGHGLKDPNVALGILDAPAVLDATTDAILGYLEL